MHALPHMVYALLGTRYLVLGTHFVRAASIASCRVATDRPWRPLGSWGLRPAGGYIARVKPSLAASLRRRSSCPTLLSSPERPTSPTSTSSGETGTSLNDEA